MDRLLIIADDVTGALDTGVQFAQRGHHTTIVFDYAALTFNASEVLVVNAESRHLAQAEAYERVVRITTEGIKAGFTFIYKKTDSALRGNIGSELAAVLAAAPYEMLAFFPAFPAFNRVTRNGIHYIDGIPVAESVFGKDPFTPVTHSSVKKIIGSQTSLPLFLNELNDKPGIHIYDGESDEDFKRLGSVIGKERLHLSAGCAAFAPYLAEIIGFERRAVPPGVLKKGLIVLSGSLHPVTIAQVGYSEQKGMKRYTLSAEQKVHLGSDTQKREAFVSEITDTYTKEGAVLIDVGTETVADQRDSGEPVKDTIAHSMGELFKSILDEGVEATYMCIGGDTLQALFRVTGISAITPVREVLPGVVLARFVYQGKERLIITKSGGFGTENVIELLWNECKGSGA